jgi:hypothetical protein
VTDAAEWFTGLVGESDISWARGEQNDLRPSEKGTVTVPSLISAVTRGMKMQ